MYVCVTNLLCNNTYTFMTEYNRAVHRYTFVIIVSHIIDNSSTYKKIIATLIFYQQINTIGDLFNEFQTHKHSQSVHQQ